MSEEKDPNGIDQHSPGAKLDDGKPLAGLLGDFSLALMAVVDVGTYGAKKYSRGGWQSVPEGQQRYTDAMWRHMLAENRGELDESGLLHMAHAAWNALARLELKLRDVSLDYRSTIYKKLSEKGWVNVTDNPSQFTLEDFKSLWDKMRDKDFESRLDGVPKPNKHHESPR